MKTATSHPLRGLAALLALLVSWPALADSGPASPAPVLTPKAVISLKYPNPWDFNRLIALTPDGRYLIDAPGAARHIRVWDWREKSVAKRLLLNEEAPDFNDGKSRSYVLAFSGGEELTLSHDGRLMAACAGKGKMAWDLGSGQRLAYIGGLLEQAPGIPEEARVTQACNSLSFSPDASWLAVAGSATLFLTAQDREAWKQADVRRRERMLRDPRGRLTPEDYADMERGIDKSFESGVALYDTQDWRLVRFLRVRPWEKVRSPILFTADGKQAIGLAYQYPAMFPKEVINTSGTEKYITNRLIRWDIASGEIVASQELPKLAPSYPGVKWSWLPGGREVWWESSSENNYQTEEEARSCVAPAPAFESEQAENCGYWWTVSVLDIETGRRRFLAPIRKNIPRKVDTIERIGASVRISPDGGHLALIKTYQRYPRGESGREFLLTRMTLDLYDLAAAKVIGTFAQGPDGSDEGGGIGWLTFSNDSRFFAFKESNQVYIFDADQAH